VQRSASGNLNALSTDGQRAAFASFDALELDATGEVVAFHPTG
jgi:hypothetical protein